MFTALLVPVPHSSLTYNIPVPVLECLSICQDNRKPAGKTTRKYLPTVIKIKIIEEFNKKNCA
jgi:hypothetical protein